MNDYFPLKNELMIESTVRLIQQQYFFSANQHVAPSPRSLLAANVQPSGQEFPTKQNGAMPYHLHIGSMSADEQITQNETRRRQSTSENRVNIACECVLCLFLIMKRNGIQRCLYRSETARNEPSGNVMSADEIIHSTSQSVYSQTNSS